MDKLFISREGLEKMKAEVAEIKARRRRVADAIEHARGLGDLKENAEYHSAKDEQAMLHARLNDLEDKIARSQPIEDQDIDTSKAYLGAKVTVLNKKTGKEFLYTLVSGPEADMAVGKISVQSPVGKALLGKSIGDLTMAQVPAGELPLEVKDIQY